jgi:hypothetical protein
METFKDAASAEAADRERAAIAAQVASDNGSLISGTSHAAATKKDELLLLSAYPLFQSGQPAEAHFSLVFSQKRLAEPAARPITSDQNGWHALKRVARPETAWQVASTPCVKPQSRAARPITSDQN